MRFRGQTQRAALNVRALVAIALIIVAGIVVWATGAFDPAAQDPTVPVRLRRREHAPDRGRPGHGDSECCRADRDASRGRARPRHRDERAPDLEGKVSAIIATSLASLAALAGIVLAWIGVGTLVFFT